MPPISRLQGEGRIDAPRGEQRGAGRGRSGVSVAHSKRSRKTSGSSRQEKGGDRLKSPRSSLLRATTVALEPEGGKGEGKSGAEGGRDGEKSKGDDNAVLQALYDGAPLSSVFHHDLAEGVWLSVDCHTYESGQGLHR